MSAHNNDNASPLSSSDKISLEQNQSEEHTTSSTDLKWPIIFHRIMGVGLILGGATNGILYGYRAAIAYSFGVVLTWFNLILIVKALQLMLKGNGTSTRWLVLFCLKLPILFTAIYLLTQAFPDEQVSLIFGCSLWVVALLMMPTLSHTQSSS